MDLTPSWSYLVQVARTRLSHNKTARHIRVYGEEIELLGVAGEFAARVFFGVSTDLHLTFDGGADIHYAGHSIDVKATQLTPRLEYRYLQWPEEKPIKADIILLTAVGLRNKSACVVGYAFADDVKKAPINHKRRYPCHEIAIPELEEPWRLLQETALGPKTYKSAKRLPSENS